MIHRYWHGPPSGLGAWTGQALRWLHDSPMTMAGLAPSTVIDWTDETLPLELVRLLDWTACQVRPEDRWRHRANVARWWLLAEHGGWWADHDLVPLVPFTDLPSPATAAHDGRRCNSWLAFPLGHPVPRQALDEIAEQPTSQRRSEVVSGELLAERLCGPDVARVELPLAGDGRRLRGDPWAVHLYESAHP